MKTLTLFLLLCGACSADIRLEAPDEPLAVKEHAIINVHGIPVASLSQAKVDLTPSDGVTLIAARSWTGQPFLLFQARRPGTYTISVSLNSWLNDLEIAVKGAQEAAGDDLEVRRLTESIRRLQALYEASGASCVVEVAGEDDNPPVPPVVADVKWIMIVLESSGQTVAQKKLFLKLRSEPKLKGMEIRVLDPTKMTTVNQGYRDRLEELPGVCLADETGKVLYAGSLPETVEEFVEKVGK